MKRFWLAQAALVGFCIWHQQATADGVIRDGLGARSSGRGGANIAFADNGEIIHDNPAGMTNVCGCGLAEAGFDILLSDLTYTDPDNPGGVDARNNAFPAGQVSLIRKGMGGRLAYGLGFFAPAGFMSDYDMNGPAPFTGTQTYKAIGMMMKFLPGVAYQVSDRLSVGGTFGVGINHMELESPYTLQSPGPLQGTPSLMDFQATGAAPVWGAGLQYQFSKRTTLGISYIAETHFRNHGDTVIQVPGFNPNEFDSRLDVTWPQSLGFGIRHRLFPRLTVAADIIWFDWSEAYEQFSVRFTNPSDPVVAAVAGPELREALPHNWRDSVSYRFGQEYTFGRGQVARFGYVYHRNPVPDGTLTPWIQTTVEHTVSLGYGFKFWEMWNFDTAYQYMWGSDRNIGTSSLVGGDFSNSRIETEAHWMYFSLLRRF